MVGAMAPGSPMIWYMKDWSMDQQIQLYLLIQIDSVNSCFPSSQWCLFGPFMGVMRERTHASTFKSMCCNLVDESLFANDATDFSKEFGSIQECDKARTGYMSELSVWLDKPGICMWLGGRANASKLSSHFSGMIIPPAILTLEDFSPATTLTLNYILLLKLAVA